MTKNKPNKPDREEMIALLISISPKYKGVFSEHHPDSVIEKFCDMEKLRIHRINSIKEKQTP